MLLALCLILPHLPATKGRYLISNVTGATPLPLSHLHTARAPAVATRRGFCDQMPPYRLVGKTRQAMKKLFDFVGSERERFEITQDNIFAFSWAKISRRLAFLDIIERRYLDASDKFIANSEAVRKLTLPGKHPVTPEQQALHDEAIPLGADVHLQIESYYLFSKIMLDHVAHAIEYYFGPAAKLPLDSHDDLSRSLNGYAAAKGLTVSAELTATIADLKRRISDVRDYKISHEKSPRTLSGTGWNHTDRLATIMMTRIFPRESDPGQFDSEPLPALRQSLHDYLSVVVDFITANRSKTALKLDAPRS
jgi:hypothetical protein